MTDTDKLEPMPFQEAVTMKGDARVLAFEAMKKRGRVEDLLQEARQLTAEAEALERSARIVQAAIIGPRLTPSAG